MQKVGVRAHLGLYEDETAALCHWHIPEAHFLEAWSDVRSDDGTVSIVQPLIAPLYSGKSAHEVLAALVRRRAFRLRPRPRALDAQKGSCRPRRGGRRLPPARRRRAAGLAAPPAHSRRSGAARAPPPGAAAAPAHRRGAAGAAHQGPATFTPPPAPTPFDLAWRRWLHDGLIAEHRVRAASR